VRLDRNESQVFDTFGDLVHQIEIMDEIFVARKIIRDADVPEGLDFIEQQNPSFWG
jgi:hypothetical protein